ncbi:MAG: alpha/beta hydrolase [Gemmataceae bacterium]|nr:alpha/beta hydrolase [Gemmataceae bacterium]
MTRTALPVVALLLAASHTPGADAARLAPGDDPIRSLDHRVGHLTNVPNYEGQAFELFVRERVPVRPNGEAVLCLHGLTIPGTVMFDLPQPGYSWMRFLAEQGYRVFSADMTGYGGSTRPPPMNDPRNLTGLDRLAVRVGVGKDDRPPYPFTMTTADSDLHDIDVAVEFVRQRTGVKRVHLVGTSLGGGRSLVYAAHHPDKVGRVVVQGWGIGVQVDNKPAKLPEGGSPVNVTTERGFKNKWELMNRRKGQVGPGLPDAVWKAMQATDPDGAKWGPGVMRAPNLSLYGWNKAVWDGVKAPVLLIHGEYDPLDPPGKALYEKLHPAEKVNLTFDGVSHVPMWETFKDRLFAASGEWLAKGSYDGRSAGEVGVDVAGKVSWKDGRDKGREERPLRLHSGREFAGSAKGGDRRPE